MTEKNISVQILLFLSAVGLSSCSLSSSDKDSSLYVDLSSLKTEASRFALLNPSGGFSSLLSAPPAAETGFSCYAVNVVGPGIGDSSSGGNPGNLGATFSALMNETSYCSYRGVVSPPVYLSGGNPQVSLQVPPGGVRLVQLIGVNDLAVCQSGVIDSPPGSNDSDPRFYEVGRAVVSDFFSDRSVDVTMNWPSANTLPGQLARADRSIECGGGDCGFIRANTSSVNVITEVINNPSISYADKLPTVGGKYLRRASLQLHTSSFDNAPVTARVTIWSGPSSDINAASATPFSKDLTIPVSVTANWVDFSLYETGMGYLQMQPTLHYWLVVSSPDASPPTGYRFLHVKVGESPSNTGTDVYKWNPISMPPEWEVYPGIFEIYSRVYGCGN